jgi:hypothetical protein
MSIYQLLFAGTTPIGSLVIGLLAQHGGVQLAVAEVAAICGLGVVAALLYLRHTRDRLSADGPLPPPAEREQALASRRM